MFFGCGNSNFNIPNNNITSFGGVAVIASIVGIQTVGDYPSSALVGNHTGLTAAASEGIITARRWGTTFNGTELGTGTNPDDFSVNDNGDPENPSILYLAIEVGGQWYYTSASIRAPKVDFSAQPQITGTLVVGQSPNFTLGTATGGNITRSLLRLDGVSKLGELLGSAWDTTGENVYGAAGLIEYQCISTTSGGVETSDLITATLTNVPAQVSGFVLSGGADEFDIVSITAPDDGNDAITGYERRVDGGSWVSVGALPDTISASVGTRSVEIRAVNAVGDGAASDPLPVSVSDGTAPILSGVTGTPGDALANLNWSTNEGTGNWWFALTSSATQPTIPQIKAFQDHTGAAAIASGTGTVTASGAQTQQQITGLTNGVGVYFHLIHDDAAGNTSAIATTMEVTPTASFTLTLSDAVWTTGTGGNTNSLALTYAYSGTDSNLIAVISLLSDGTLPSQAQMEGETGNVDETIEIPLTPSPIDLASSFTIAGNTNFAVLLKEEPGTGSGVTSVFTGTMTAVDFIPPTLSSSSPADNATGVLVGASPSLTFNKAMFPGSGEATIRDNDGGFADLEAFDVETEEGTGNGEINFTGNTVTMNPLVDFANLIEHSIQVDPGAFVSAQGIPFAGIADDTTVSFTTEAGGVTWDIEDDTSLRPGDEAFTADPEWNAAVGQNTGDAQVVSGEAQYSGGEDDFSVLSVDTVGGDVEAEIRLTGNTTAAGFQFLAMVANTTGSGNGYGVFINPNDGTISVREDFNTHNTTSITFTYPLTIRFVLTEIGADSQVEVYVNDVLQSGMTYTITGARQGAAVFGIHGFGNSGERIDWDLIRARTL